MMKKQFAIISFILLIFLGANLSLYADQQKTEASQPVVIPDEAIRLRILANSDDRDDQALKRKVRDDVNAQITNWVEDLISIEDARALIKSRLPEIENIVAQTLKKEGKEQAYTVEFGEVNFPTKMYGNYIYPAGKYEAILITLGNGEGANWWCVLFPPLCFLDFSNSEAVDLNKQEQAKETTEKKEELVVDDEEKVEVKFFIIEFITNIFED